MIPDKTAVLEEGLGECVVIKMAMNYFRVGGVYVPSLKSGQALSSSLGFHVARRPAKL